MHLTFDSLSVEITSSPNSNGLEIHVHIQIHNEQETGAPENETKDFSRSDTPTEECLPQAV
ncbi:hypothetical protein [Acanthopleuribacter pedis]|uniref:Uncharacterized protein n=1 Tax=Acanthopleuribacter pedis TaxID=442870 RepID=A0A8J7U433_9BACT|nr:hypothetical protein [Acanthopleuribacter pedis]MBO1318958.1 hypothetical protein [Acanthopleuribacter pedis]